MSNEDALKASIKDNPGQTTPRLVYADWLDDQDGRGHEAALHRFIAEPGNKEYRDNLVAAHGGDHSAAALAVTHEVRAHSNTLYPWGAHLGLHTEDHPAEQTLRAAGNAYHAADDIPAAGKRDRHLRAMQNHNRAAAHHYHVLYHPQGEISREDHDVDEIPDHWVPDITRDHTHAAELHKAAAVIHKFAAIAYGSSPGK